MKNAKMSILSALLLLSVVGCAGKTGVAGKWKGKAMDPPTTTESFKEMEAKIVSGSKLDFRGDGTVTTSIGGMSVEGKYTSNGSAIEVMMNPVMGETVKPMAFELSSDGKTLTRKPMAGNNQSMIFERE